MSLAGILTAIVYVLTAYLHIPSYTGYVHVGDAFIYLAAAMLPLPYAAFVGAGGAMLADCLTGYATWAPASVIIKAATVLFFSSKREKILTARNVIALLPSWAVCIGGYYLYEAIISANFVSPAAGIPGNIMQCLFSTVVYLILGFTLDRFKAKQKIA